MTTDAEQQMNENLCLALRDIANAITPLNLMPGIDATGGRVSSLTEALMGHTNAMMKMADAMSEIASSIECFQDELGRNTKTLLEIIEDNKDH